MSEPVTWATENLQDVMSPRYRQMHMDDKSSTWKQFPIPLYAHPMRELTDEEIAVVYKKVIETSGHNFAYEYARAIIKASRGEK